MRIKDREYVYYYVTTVWRLHLRIQIVLWRFCAASSLWPIPFQMRRRGIVFIVSGELSMHGDFRRTLIDACIVPRIVPLKGPRT
jgi:hypothetical protein